MKRLILSIALALMLIASFAIPALADTTAGVTVTATPGWVSITNAPIDYDFDVVLAGSTPNTGNGHFTITNDSTVAMDVSIECDGWTGDPNSWTYGAPAADTGRLNASSADGGVGGSSGAGAFDIAILVGSGTLLCDDVTVGTTPTWELELEAPTSFTHVDEQETTVTLTASVD